MDIRNRMLPALLAAGLVGAGTAGGSSAGSAAAPSPEAKAAVSFNYAKVEFAVLRRTPIRGIVSASQREQGDESKITVSLDDLTPNTDYLVVGSGRKCSRAPTPASTSYTIELKNTTISSYFVATTKQAKPTRIVRVFEVPATGAATQKACGVTVRDSKAE